MRKLIDINELLKHSHDVTLLNGAKHRCIDATVVHEIPIVDAEQIIRCKDCKWFGDIGCAISIVDDTDRPSENDYCSFAERKE